MPSGAVAVAALQGGWERTAVVAPVGLSPSGARSLRHAESGVPCGGPRHRRPPSVVFVGGVRTVGLPAVPPRPQLHSLHRIATVCDGSMPQKGEVPGVLSHLRTGDRRSRESMSPQDPPWAPAALSGMREAVMNARRSLRLAFATLWGLAWCWSMLRVVAEPGQAGPVEEGIAAGGWTLSVLPVHVSWRRRRVFGRAHRPPLALPVHADGAPEVIAVSPWPTPFPAGPGISGRSGDGGGGGVPMPPPRRPAVGAARASHRQAVPAGATAMSALAEPWHRPGQPPDRPGGGAGPRWHEGHQ